MDFTPLDENERYGRFAAEVRAFLDENLTPDVIADTEQRGDRHHPEFFRKLGERGWVVPGLPRDVGGAELDYREVEILDGELFRRGAPTMNISTTRLVVPAVLDFAQEAVRDDIVRSATGGHGALALGYTEPHGGSDIADVRTRATRGSDGNWVVSGQKIFTSGAHHASHLFLLTTSDPNAPRRQGLTMFIMPLDLDGVTIHAIETIGERTNTVFLDDVRVADKYRLGVPEQGWDVLSGPLNGEHSAVAHDERGHADMGLNNTRRLARAFEAAVDQVVQDGTADDPLTQQRLGQVALLAWMGSSLPGIGGRVIGAANLTQGVDELVDMLGPLALAREGAPAAKVAYAWRHAQVSTVYGGTVEVFRNLIARELGLPRPAGA